METGQDSVSDPAMGMTVTERSALSEPGRLTREAASMQLEAP
jgi:hypothetical protein